MKYILLSITTFFIPLTVYAQETLDETLSQTPTSISLSFWEILLAVLAPLTLFIIAYLLIKRFKL